MELNVNIDPEQINKLVADAVLHSAIGKQVEEQVKRCVDELGRSYHNPIEDVIKCHIRDMVRDVLGREYAETIKEQVRTSLAEKMTDDLIGKILDRGLSSY